MFLRITGLCALVMACIYTSFLFLARFVLSLVYHSSDNGSSSTGGIGYYLLRDQQAAQIDRLTGFIHSPITYVYILLAAVAYGLLYTFWIQANALMIRYLLARMIGAGRRGLSLFTIARTRRP